MENNERKAKNSEARIRANNKYKKANYQRISVDIRPEQAEAIRETAKQFDVSIAQLIINSVNEYKINHGADTAQPEQPEQPEADLTETPMKSEETAGAERKLIKTDNGSRADTKRRRTRTAGQEPIRSRS